jgi:hypothetical protein
MSENDLEKPEPDVEEQRQPVTDEGADEQPPSFPFDVNEADAVEQHREVSLDEDDYR